MSGMDLQDVDPAALALVLVDMQNDFLAPDGAYARAGVSSPLIAPLAARLAPLCDAVRGAGGWIVSTHFTLVPGRGGEPFIADHLKALRPFLGRGDFAPGSRGHALVDALAPADLSVEKVAYDAFHQSRLEFVLRRAGVAVCVFAGIVTNGGVASTVRGAHVRDFRTVVLEDGCGAFSEQAHEAALGSLRTISPTARCAEFMAAL